MSDKELEVNPDILELIDKSVEAGVSKGIERGMKEVKKMQEIERQNQYDTRKYNTELLLKNYRNFKKHVDDSVYSSQQVLNLEKERKEFKIDFNEPMDDTYIKSIIKSKTTTRILLEQIDVFIEYFLRKCAISKRREINRRGEVINLLYIKDLEEDLEKQKITFEEVAEELNTSAKTVNRDRKAAIKELSVLFFGIEGLKIK